MNWRKWRLELFILLVITLAIYINYRYKIIVLPTENLIDYQFNLFTVTSALAGFSFTTLGILLGMGSETLINKLKDTKIVIARCQKITISFVFFCISSIISLYFIIGGDNVTTRILFKIFGRDFIAVNQTIFLFEILCLFVGLIYFIISICSVYDLIKRVYGHTSKNYEKLKNDFMKDLNEAKKRQDSADAKIDKVNVFLEK